MLFLTLSWYHETNKSWSHENQAETNNNAQPLWASVIIFAKFCFGATMDFKSLYYSRTWSFVSWNQRDISTQDFLQLQFHTENQWTCGLTPAELLPVHLALIQDVSIFFPHSFESAFCSHFLCVCDGATSDVCSTWERILAVNYKVVWLQS